MGLLIKLVLLCGCASVVAPRDANIIEIVKVPKDYNGKVVRVTGILSFTSGGILFYPSCRIYSIADIDRSLQIDEDSVPGLSKSNFSTVLMRLHATEVTVTGVIDATHAASENRIGGWIAIKKVALIQTQPNKTLLDQPVICEN